MTRKDGLIVTALALILTTLVALLVLSSNESVQQRSSSIQTVGTNLGLRKSTLLNGRGLQSLQEKLIKRFYNEDDDGIRVQWSVTKLPSNDDVFDLIDKNGHCDDSQTCSYSWGDRVDLNATVQLSETIDKDDLVVGSIKIDRFIPYKFTCLACGQDCKIVIPVINANFTIEMPSECPIRAHTLVVQHVAHSLWKRSPTNGVVTTKLEGSISIIKKSESDSRTTIASVKIKATVK